MAQDPPDLDSLFLSALEIESPEERAAFLSRFCGGDASLRAEVEQLLASHRVAGSFLETPALGLDATLWQGPAGEDRAAALQAGLSPAFREGEAVVLGGAGHSVLKAFAQTIEVPHVVLRDAAARGGDPIVRPRTPEMPDRDPESRYQLDGEIARGGMGAILKGRDTDLGRDLAIKVLLDVHKDRPEIIQRFIEEAQIGGQLQHPGIAPVYELGQFSDSRPFFSMKLVKGETLSKLLADRQDPTADRGKFIGIFEQVCQTMAYSHSRGVIHRDLKPANIMVGAFGEVQVVDWGLAKVLSAGGVADEKKALGRQQGQSVIRTLRSGGSGGGGAAGTFGSVGSQTQMGSVMGTPAYMPPEQALGEIDNLDERADVFGLGAILCEILTGAPPYVGADATAVFRQAARGKLDDCMSRLDACGADAELIALAKRCLELEPSNRPRDAGVLAKRVSGYLESVEAKLRASEMAKVDAQVRAEELVRRHKLAAAAGTAVAASLVIGLAASVWQAVRAEHEATRARSAEQRTVATLDELRATAPAFAEQARTLAAKEQFGEAIRKLDYALKLRPDGAEFLVAKGDLLQCQMKLAAAAATYRDALRVKPGLARAEASAKFCDELLAAKPSADGTLTRESLAKLHLVMQQQQRPAAELMPVARLLGEEKRLVVEYWLARLKDLPVSAEKPLKDRLTVREDGRLALDLSDTKVTDLSPLVGAPLSVLDVSGSRGRRELADLSPLRGLDLIELNISATSVADLTPLREMHTLEKLEMSGSKVTDLAALGGLRLKTLGFRGCPVSDLNPIARMPIEELYLRETRVADLTPLVRMPIKVIDLTMSPVLDFSPLARLPLERCYLQNNRITDLSVLRGKPLKELVLWGCVDARNYAALAEIKTLELLLLPSTYRDLPAEDYAAIGALRGHPRLRQLGSEIMNQMGYSATGPKDVFWRDWDREQTFVPALRRSEIRFSLTKLPTGSYHLFIQNQPLRDLSVLKGAPISELVLDTCPVSDLAPIHELRLETLRLSTDLVADLGPLRGMPLRTLSLAGSNFRDLSPLTGLPLRQLFLDRCPNVTDVSPLGEIPTLEVVSVPLQARRIETLRKLTGLQRLGCYTASGIPDTTAKEFWSNYVWISRLGEAGFQARALKRLPDETWEVDLSGTKLSDLTLLSGAPISRLDLSKTEVADLNPLRGMPLKSLQIGGTRVSDLSPLRGMPLETLSINGTGVTDLLALRGMPLVNLGLHDLAVTDLSPLAEAKQLTSVTLPPNARDFGFLRSLPDLAWISFHATNGNPDRTAAEFWKEYDTGWARALRESGVAIQFIRQLADGTWHVNLTRSAISDLAVLKGAPICYLNLGNTAVSDLSPLRGMALKRLEVYNTKVTDLSPLTGMPLESLHMGGTKVSDLSPLRGMPLVDLRLHFCSELTDLSPLAECRALRTLILPTGVKDVELFRSFPRLERISFKEDMSPGAGRRPDKTAAEFWKEYDGQAWLRKLRASGVTNERVKQLPEGTWDVDLSDSGMSDLTALSGSPISSLNLNGTPVSSLAPLRGMAIKRLTLAATKVTDLSPLTGMPLDVLHLNGTKVTDLSALHGMPLTSLRLFGCTELTDLAPLADCKSLQDLTLPPNAKNIESLRASPKLERIGFKEDKTSGNRPDRTAAEFWKEYDEKTRVAGVIRDAGFTLTALTRRADGTWEVNLTRSEIGDLKALRRLPIGGLLLGNTAVTDLEPFRGMALKRLILWNTKVTDLSPLTGMPLENLSVSGTKVNDVSPLRGMPLTYLRFHDCRALTDLSALADCKTLESLTLPPNVKNIEFLRAFPKLQFIGFTEDPKRGYRPDKTAAEFWKEYDASKNETIKNASLSRTIR